MGKTYERNGIWYVDLRINGRRYRKKAGKNKHLAELLLKDLEVKAERNQLGFLDQKKIDLDVFLKEFLAYSQANHRPATTTRYKAALENFMRFIHEETHVKWLSDITTDTVEKFRIWRKNIPVSPNGSNPKRVKPQFVRKGARSYTVNFEVMSLKTMLNLAVKWGHLDSNPSTGVKKLKVEDSKKRRFLTETECERLLVACDKETHPIFFTLLYTGMRKGELINLEWTDIDFTRDVIKIQRKAFWIPKAGEREIPMSRDVAETLQKLPKHSNFVFADKEGNSLSHNWIRNELIRIVKKAGIQNLTEVHALRHTFASRLLMKGVDLPTVQKLMGHTQIQTTMIYSHQTPEHLREAVERLSLGTTTKPNKNASIS